VTQADSGFTVETLNRMMGEFNQRIGMKLVEVSPERVVGTVPVEGNRQPYGLIHGGVNAALGETLGSVAAAVNAGPTRAAMGLELSCTHHRAATSGLVTGVCTPLHVGRTVSTFETVITDDQGRRTCTVRLTCLLRDTPPGANSQDRNGQG
jgi:1,4-dihydroxy-2-naphthoyl-CoA hydrolase